MLYRRTFSPPSTSDDGKDNTVTTWGPLFGFVPLNEAVEMAETQGFKATALLDGRLRLDYAHSLVSRDSLVCSVVSQHSIIYLTFYRDGSTAAQDCILWESDQQEVCALLRLGLAFQNGIGRVA